MTRAIKKKIKNRASRVKKGIDAKLLGFASKSMEQFKGQIQKKTSLDFEGDVVKQLGRIILNKAQKIREVLAAEDVKVPKKTSSTKVKKVVVRASKAKTATQKRTSVKKKSKVKNKK